MAQWTHETYNAALEERGVLPEGFRVSTVPVSFLPRERESSRPHAMNLSLIAADRPTPSFGAVYTRNAFPGFPVVVGRKRLEETVTRGVVVNTRVANVACPGGMEAIEEILAAVAATAGGSAVEYIPASTGVIGWGLPVAEMVAAVPTLVGGLRGGSIVPIARAIMTTDSYPKVRSAKVGEGSIVAIAKGAGMIEPNLATLLVFVLTDCAVERAALRTMLAEAVEETFNRISVDGDQSTSDSVLALSSGRRGRVSDVAFGGALESVLRDLSEDVVRNGEGVGHVIRVAVTGAPDRATAVGCGKAVANSPLVKTAIYGNDPNVGRLASALGDYLGGGLPGSHRGGLGVDPLSVALSLCGETVFRRGVFALDPDRERRLCRALEAASMPTTGKTHPPHDERVEIGVDLGSGDHACHVLGADLSYDYVRENADYRS